MKKVFVALFIVGSILESTLGFATKWDDSVQESTLASGSTSLFRYEAKDGCVLESYVIVDGKKLTEERDAAERPEFSSNFYVDYLKLLSEAMADSPDSSVP